MSDDVIPSSADDLRPPDHDDDDWYGQHKRDLAVAVLPKRRYRRAFEPGCGDGRLSLQLAERCDELVSWDSDPGAAAAAAVRLAAVGHAHVAQARLPDDWPDGTADLIVLSEVGCFLSPADLDAVLDRCLASLDPGGVLVGVHRRMPMPHYPGGADDVHARLFCLRGLFRTGGYADEDLRIDVFERPPA